MYVKAACSIRMSGGHASEGVVAGVLHEGHSRTPSYQSSGSPDQQGIESPLLLAKRDVRSSIHPAIPGRGFRYEGALKMVLPCHDRFDITRHIRSRSSPPSPGREPTMLVTITSSIAATDALPEARLHRLPSYLMVDEGTERGAKRYTTRAPLQPRRCAGCSRRCSEGMPNRSVDIVDCDPASSSLDEQDTECCRVVRCGDNNALQLEMQWWSWMV